MSAVGIPTYDVIIWGAGAAGSAAAYHCAQAGQRTLLLEQFEFNHARGSSHGNSRIIRYMYDHPAYIRLMKAAYPAWTALEHEAGEKLYIRTGGVDFGPPDAATLRAALTSADETHIPYEIWSPDETRQRFPQFVLPEGCIGVYQADAGILAASRCVQTHLRLAQAHGAELRSGTQVTAIEVTGDSLRISVRTGSHSDQFSAARLIICAGAWTNQLLEQLGVQLPLEPQRCQYSFFRAAVPERFNADRFPIFISHYGSKPSDWLYGLPDYDGAGLKIGFHGGPPIPDMAAVNYTPDADYPERIRTQMQRYLPDIATSQPLDTQVCLYTMTPDGHFIIDHHPEYAQIVIASPCSGHGFKFSTLIGKILYGLAFEGATEHDLSLFRLSRF